MRRVSASATELATATCARRVPEVSTIPVEVKVTARLVVLDVAVTPGVSPLALLCRVAAGLTWAMVQPAPPPDSSVKVTLEFRRTARLEYALNRRVDDAVA